MRYKEFLKSKFFWVCLSFILVYIIFLMAFQQYEDIWWDSASYVGMGRYLFSGGATGLFEPHKPILLPLALGLFWKLGFNDVLAGMFLIFLLSLLSLYFTYRIGKELFNERIGIIASAILGLNPLFFIFSFRVYSEMLSVCFILGALFFMIRFSNTNKLKYIFVSSMFCFLSVLSKYPNGIIIILLEIYLLCLLVKSRNMGPMLFFNVSLLLFFIPFLTGNYIFSGDPLYLLHISQDYLKANLGMMYSFNTFPGIPKLFFENTNMIYFKSILHLFNVIFPFLFMGIYLAIKKNNMQLNRLFFLVFPTFILFFFFEIFYLKQERYILPLFPLLSIFCALGLSKIKLKFAYILLILYLVISISFSSYFLYITSLDKGYGDFFKDTPNKGLCQEASTSDPLSVLNSNIKTLNFPYEVFDKTWNGGSIKENNPDCIVYFSCYENRSNQIDSMISMNYSLELKNDNGRCTYAFLRK